MYVIISNFSTTLDFEFNLKFEVLAKKDHDKVKNLSISNLGDIIAILDKINTIKLLSQNLETLFIISDKSLIDTLDVFSITNDSRHLCTCYYGKKDINFFYKNYNISDISKETFLRKEISFRSNIIKLNEMAKNLLNYYEAGDNTIYFVLLGDYQFLILRKIINKVKLNKIIF